MDGGQKSQSRNALEAEVHGGEQGAPWGQAVCRALGLRALTLPQSLWVLNPILLGGVPSQGLVAWKDQSQPGTSRSDLGSMASACTASALWERAKELRQGIKWPDPGSCSPIAQS